MTRETESIRRELLAEIKALRLAVAQCVVRINDLTMIAHDNQRRVQTLESK